jgi:DHA1 family inner membrane transport protein
VIVTGIMLLIVIFLAMPFFERSMVPAVGIVFVWGCVHFAAGSPLQARIVDQAKGAPNLASTLNQGAFNLGNALGASLGGIMLTEGVGYQYLSLGSAAVASIALLVALVALRLERNENSSAEKDQMVSV